MRTTVAFSRGMGNIAHAAPKSSMNHSEDIQTAAAFATSWQNCYTDSPYTRDQYLEWMLPLTPDDLKGRRICELGCGHGGLLRYTGKYASLDGSITGVDLGDSVDTARENFRAAGIRNATFVKQDIFEYSAAHEGEFDVVYCIGVLHHMKSPEEGFRSVIRATAPGGRFHCWVYGYEGTALVRHLVEPIRRVAWRLPWWVNKYGVALPLTIPFFVLSKAAWALRDFKPTDALPMVHYFRHVGEREFQFHHHIAFDQLVAPQTTFLRRGEIERWLANASDQIEDAYILPRNGNSWKFGGKRKR
jgi:SAM-dependent methyltransferase